MKISAIVLGGLMLATQGALLAQQPTKLVTLSGPAPTDISGSEPGTQTQRLEAPENYILYAIEFGEDRDIPCHIVAKYYSLEVRQATELVATSRERGSSPRYVLDKDSINQSFSHCPGSVGDLASVTIPNWGSPGNVIGIASILVCQRSGNDRLKGITITGATVSSGGVTQNSSIADTHDRRRCNQPQQTVSCSNNRIATGLVISSSEIGKRNSGDRKVSGLGLLCSRARLNIERPEGPLF